MTNTYSHAALEFEVLSKSATDPENRPIIEPFKNEILALCERFGLSGQSGGSAPMTATAISQAVKKLLLQEPICPIMGVEDEWVNVMDRTGGNDIVYQNRRCAGVFKYANGECSYVDAIIKKTQTGNTYHGSFWLSREAYLAGDKTQKVGSVQLIKSFPFVPKTFYIDVIEEEVAKDDWEMYLKNPKQLEKVWEYYNKRDFKKKIQPVETG